MKRRVLKLCLYVLAPLAVAALAVVGSGWLWSWKAPLDPATLPGTLTLAPGSAAAPGRAVTAEVVLKLPVRFEVAKATVEPGQGSVVSGKVRYASRWRWSHNLWRLSVTLRGLRPGEIPSGKLEVALKARGGRAAEKILFEIPGFTVGDPDPAEQELQLAAPEKTAQPVSKLHWLWLLAIPVALLAWMLLRRRREDAREIPPWERAHAALAALDAGTRGGKVAPERGIGKLTDIVRSYLEARFSLPASSRTTPEFLAGLDSDGTPLDRSDRAFLREFMNEADLVKFARAEASCDALVSAIGKAETLVENTTPHEGTDGREAEK